MTKKVAKANKKPAPEEVVDQTVVGSRVTSIENKKYVGTDSILNKYLESTYKLRNIPQLFIQHSIGPDSYFDIKNVVNVYCSIENRSNIIDIILVTPGGIPSIGFQLLKFLRSKFEQINFIVPSIAKSTGTLIALGGDEIIFGINGELGPLDMQVPKEVDYSNSKSYQSALIDFEALRTVETKAKITYLQFYDLIYSKNDIKIDSKDTSEQLLSHISDFYKPLIEQLDILEISKMKRALDQGKEYAKRALKMVKNPEDKNGKKGLHKEDNIDSLVNFLVNSCPDHGYNIDNSIVSEYLENTKNATDLETIGEEYGEVLDKLGDLMDRFYYTNFSLDYTYLYDGEITYADGKE